jgi:hypothetical protein
MLDHSAVVHDIGSVPEDNLDAVSVQVQNSGVEVALIVASRGRCTVGATPGIQGRRVKVSNGCPTRSGECNVRGTSFYTILCCQLRCA